MALKGVVQAVMYVCAGGGYIATEAQKCTKIKFRGFRVSVANQCPCATDTGACTGGVNISANPPTPFGKHT